MTCNINGARLIDYSDSDCTIPLSGIAPEPPNLFVSTCTSIPIIPFGNTHHRVKLY